ncbi:MAG: iron-sulfur cluster repair di-iron protein [Acidobacteria bacterium]|nr:iron-sulfur cluster repair di-iron protein [Acidobacteriota bacterium]
MQINTQETVGQLAVHLPSAPRVFEQFGIDYCCGGQQTLAAACAQRHVPLDRVLDSLAEAAEWQQLAGAPRDWRGATLTALQQFIVDTHHVFTRQELARLEKLAAKVYAAHGSRHPELARLQELFLQLKEELLPHMLKEEQVLFPYVARLEEAAQAGQPAPPAFFGTVNQPVRMMMREHDTAGDLLKALRQTAGDYVVPADACPSFRALYQALPELEADLHQHIHLENNLHFPRAVELEAQLAPELQSMTQAFRCLGH